MKTEQIIYLDDLSKTHSISQTAQRFFISQQALSFSIKKLEEEFDTVFLSRSNHGVQLTKAGEYFLEKTRSLIDSYYALKQDLKLEVHNLDENVSSPSGTIHIISHTRVLEPLLLDVLENYMRKYPDVKIILNEEQNIDIIRHIAEGEGDFGILFIPDAWLKEQQNSSFIPEHVKLEPLFSDEFIVCCSKNHPLIQKKNLSLDQFPGSSVVRYDANPIMLPLENKEPDSSQFFSGNTGFHTGMVQRGLAVAVITAFEFRKLHLKNKDLSALPLKNSLKSTISIVQNTSCEPSAAVKLFLRMLKTFDFYRI